MEAAALRARILIARAKSGLRKAGLVDAVALSSSDARLSLWLTHVC